jgi:hypothetical protein
MTVIKNLGRHNSALCIFEKHMLALVDLIHALPTKGEKSTQFMFSGGVCIKER